MNIEYWKVNALIMGEVHIWAVRDDGMERCLSRPNNDRVFNWHNPTDLGDVTVDEWMHQSEDDYKFTKLSREEAMLECI